MVYDFLFFFGWATTPALHRFGCAKNKKIVKLFKILQNRPIIINFLIFFRWVVAYPSPGRAPPLAVLILSWRLKAAWLIVCLAQLWAVPQNVLKTTTSSWVNLVTTSVEIFFQNKNLRIQIQQFGNPKTTIIL